MGGFQSNHRVMPGDVTARRTGRGQRLGFERALWPDLERRIRRASGIARPSRGVGAALVSLAALALLVSGTAPAVAGTEPISNPVAIAASSNPDSDARGGVRVGASPERRPAAKTPLDSTDPRVRRMQARREAPPLTRAAARQHVESISPARWLEGFGSITVERRE